MVEQGLHRQAMPVYMKGEERDWRRKAERMVYAPQDSPE
jgi:hypothetical protein